MRNCPICKSNKTNLFYKKGSNLYICEQCRHIFWGEDPSEQDLTAYYAESYSNQHNQMTIQSQEKEYYKSHIKELLKHAKFKLGKTVIADYGCSYPTLLMEAEKMGLKTVGIEWDKEYIKIGQEHRINMITPDELHKISDNSIDIIRFSHVIEHMSNPAEVMKNISTKVKKDGVLYITQPSFPIYHFQEVSFDIKDSVYPEHLQFFSPISLVGLVEQAGFSIEKFFTHQNAEEILKRDILDIDVQKGAMELHRFADLGESFFGAASNYPLYCGENSVLYARKK